MSTLIILCIAGALNGAFIGFLIKITFSTSTNVILIGAIIGLLSGIVIAGLCKAASQNCPEN